MATIFTGSSRYSADFQSVIDRAVAIKSLPLQQKQNQVATLQSQSSELSSIDSAFSSLSAAIANLESALGIGSFTASATDTDVATVVLSGTPLPGSFSIEVAGLGVYSTSMSKDGLDAVTDPSEDNLSDATSFSLQVGSSTYTIAPADRSLTALAEAINFHSQANVQATVVNLGSASAPDYRLSLQGIKLGDLPIQLNAIDGANPGQQLMTAQNTGSPATYRVNGKPAQAIESDTRTVTVSPGVVVTLRGEGNTEVHVERSTGAISSALTRFVTAYNAAQAAIDRNRGEDAGALQGQSILSTLSDALHRISQYEDAGSDIGSLTALGLTFDRDGVLSFDATTFSSATSGKIYQLTSFLGSSTDGGFLKLAADTIETITGAETGVLTNTRGAIGGQIDRENQAISEQQERIDRMRAQIEAQIAAADAAIASMEQQYTYLSNMFTAMQENSKAYQ